MRSNTAYMDFVYIPEYVKMIIAELRRAGFEAYAVGGAVRDTIMRTKPHDWDVATSAKPEETAAVFKRTFMTGEKYGTVTVIMGSNSAEVTTFRSEADYCDSRHPENISFSAGLTEDLKRRDFTINAMAMDEYGEITDIFGGRDDIEKRIIRCVGNPEERFMEDALRMLRAMRFSAKLGFGIEDNTYAAVVHLADRTKSLSAERIRQETEQILLSAKPKVMNDVLRLGLCGDIIPKRGADTPYLEKISKLPNNEELRWAAFAGILRYTGGEECTSLLRKMKLSRKIIVNAGKGAELAQTKFASDTETIKNIIAEHGVDTARCACAAAGPLWGFCRYKTFVKVIKSGECCTIKDLAITGKDVIEARIADGEAVGECLRKVLKYIIKHPEMNEREKILAYLFSEQEKGAPK